MRKRFGSFAMILASSALLWVPIANAQQESSEDDDEDEREQMEEVLVTGSFIPRDNFDLPSPMDVITALDLELAATPDLGDVIFDQTYQIGVNANAAPFEHGSGRPDNQSENYGIEVWSNIRGLGTRATMTMMDSHRVPANVQGYGPGTRRAGSDVNASYPGIAIGRVETVLDGASALYGSEAVSGVVNIIPNKSFEGMRANYSVQQAVENGEPSRTFSLLAGAQSEQSSAIFAMSIRDVDRMSSTARPRFIIASAGWTGQLLPTWTETGSSHPGDWRVPFRNETGELAPWTPSGWAQFNNPSDAPPGWIATSAPWFLYPPGEPIRLLVDDFDGDGEPDVEEFGYGGETMADTTGRLKVLRKYDPGCGFPFGAGNDDLGDQSDIFAIGQWGLMGYNDSTKDDNFRNGYLTGNVHGRETRTSGTEASAGSEYDCRRVTSDYQDIQSKNDREQGMSFFEHRFNDYVSLHGEIVINRLDTEPRQNDWFGIDEWGTAAGEDPLSPNVAMVLGHNPGNPFRAFADGSNSCTILPNLPGCDEFTNQRLHTYIDDNNTTENTDDDVERTIDIHDETELSYIDANGNGVYDYLEEAGEWLVYAADSNGDGLPDRDANGDGVADDNELSNPSLQHSHASRVILLPLDTDSDGDGVPDRFDPDSHGTIGVRLFEDVRMAQLAAHPKQRYVHESYPWLNEDMSFSRRHQSNDLRLRLGTTVSIPDTNWNVNLDWVFAQSKRETDWLEPIWHWSLNSFRCRGGREGNQCWNPFSTAWLDSDPETGELLHAWRDKDDPAWNTALETRNAGLVMRADQRIVGFSLLDLTASNSSVFNLWYNDAPVGFAAGIHHRVETEEYRPNQVGAASLGSSVVSFQYTEEETNAIYAEIALPLIVHPTWGDMEVLTALRYAEFEGRGSLSAAGETANFNVTIPKFAMRYSPTEWVSFRASRTQGFVLPGMFQLFNQTDGEGRDTRTVRDYTCDLLPELPHCAGVAPGGGVPDVVVDPNSANRDLQAEDSELWNGGISFRLLDGDLTMDFDYTDVEFNGRAERVGVDTIVRMNEIGFEDHMKARCGDTLLDYDNSNRYPAEEYPDIPRTPIDFDQVTPIAERECRLSAVEEWLANERSLAGAVLVRDNNRLVGGADAWLNQGSAVTRTLIIGANYNFDSSEIPLIGGDYGTFGLSGSATKYLEMSIVRWASGSGHQFAGIKVDGVGNRNAVHEYAGSYMGNILPATPDYRINMGLRWFNGPHTLQFSGRFHPGVTDIHAGYDEITQATQHLITDPDDKNGLNSNSNWFGADIREWTEEQTCIDQDRNPYCKIHARAYWDLSYVYNKSDIFGLGYVSINLAVRNLFDTYPKAIPSGIGYEAGLDNGMGRLAFVSVNVGL